MKLQLGMKKIICFAPHYLSQSVQETIDSVMVILQLVCIIWEM